MRRAALALWLGLSLCASGQAADCLRIGAPAGAGATDEIMSVVREAGKRAGLCVETMRAPTNRLSALALDGAIVAEPDLPEADPRIAVPTPVAIFEGTLYWLPSRPQPSGPAARIGVILGQNWALRAVRARGSQPYEVRDNRQLMKMLAAGRLDGMMLPSISYRHFRPAFPALQGCKAETVASLPVRLLLDGRHSAVARDFDQALDGLRRDGTTEAIFKRYAP
jgi:hypothetical protein